MKQVIRAVCILAAIILLHTGCVTRNSIASDGLRDRKTTKTTYFLGFIPIYEADTTMEPGHP